MMIINNLQLHGYEAFAVGGCVRDSILARRPEDWDITTSARRMRSRNCSEERWIRELNTNGHGPAGEGSL